MVTQFVKRTLKIDDSLDVFAVHGIGGALGTLLAAVFVSASLGGKGFAEGMSTVSQLGVQAVGVIVVVAYSAVLTFVIVKLLAIVLQFRVSNEDEVTGLDLAMHGERGYDNL
jgi:Amt family ammonium transporter